MSYKINKFMIRCSAFIMCSVAGLKYVVLSCVSVLLVHHERTSATDTAPPTTLKCYGCRDVIDPQFCSIEIECPEYCFVNERFLHSEKRYDLACGPRKQCEALAGLHFVQHTCTYCCNDRDLCNGHACNTNTTTSTTTTTATAAITTTTTTTTTTVENNWSDWSQWGACTVTCGIGQHERRRFCTHTDSALHTLYCPGNNIEHQACKLIPCTGVCEDNPHINCTDISVKAAVCSEQSTAIQLCPKSCNLCMDGHWSHWNNWSTCTVTCGTGQHTRLRNCTYPDITLHGTYCPGSNANSQNCNTFACPVDGHWSAWEQWGPCTTTCGTGHQERHRNCIFSTRALHGSYCPGSSTDRQSCSANPCPVDGKWLDWSQWSNCPVTCGGGDQDRLRSCHYENNAPRGNPCAGSSHELQRCQTDICPVDGKWSDWSQWDACTKTCGTGQQSRNRHCTYPSQTPYGNPCLGNDIEYNVCSTSICPGVCQDNPSVNCSDNVVQSVICNTPSTALELCPKSCHVCVDGHWSEWGTWNSCTLTCGTGMRMRYRNCLYTDLMLHGANCPGNIIDIQYCNTNSCPVYGFWSAWGPWSHCSATCGTGQHERYRNCTFPDKELHGTYCSGSNAEHQVCMINRCSGDCQDNSRVDCADVLVQSAVCSSHVTALELCPTTCKVCQACVDNEHVNCSNTAISSAVCATPDTALQLCPKTCRVCDKLTRIAKHL